VQKLAEAGQVLQAVFRGIESQTLCVMSIMLSLWVSLISYLSFPNPKAWRKCRERSQLLSLLGKLATLSQ